MVTLMTDTGDSKGYCPNCQSTDGQPWDPCTNASCKTKGYHLIPEKYALTLQEFPKKNHELVGQLIESRYLLVQKIGEGGMGFIFLGLQKPFMREVAVKVISAAHLDESNKERFAREARALSMLDHPNIVKMLDYGVHRIEAYHRELPFMVLEYVKDGIELGKFFRQLKKAGKQASRKVVVHIFSQVLSALETAHAQGLVHRDIKPSNILLKKVAGNPFMVKLLDFGLAKALGNTEGFSNKQLTTNGMLMGTPQYLAPEQGDIKKLFEGKIDHRADLYSVGVTLYEVLTGVKAFPFKDQLQILVMKSSPRYDPLKAPAARELPDSVKDFLRKAMARDPEERFQDARAFRHAMKHALLKSDVGIKGISSSDEDSTHSTPSGDLDVNWELVEIAADSEEDFGISTSSSHARDEIPPLPPQIHISDGQASDEFIEPVEVIDDDADKAPPSENPSLTQRELVHVKQPKSRRGLMVALAGLVIVIAAGGAWFFTRKPGPVKGQKVTIKHAVLRENRHSRLKPRDMVTDGIKSLRRHAESFSVAWMDKPLNHKKKKRVHRKVKRHRKKRNSWSL